MDEMNLNQKQLDRLMKMAKQKSGMDINQLKDSVEQGNLDDFVNKNLDSQGAEKLKQVLSDRKSAENLLKSEQAQQLMKKLLEGK